MDPAHPAGRRVARWPGIIARFGSGHKAGPTRAEHIERGQQIMTHVTMAGPWIQTSPPAG